MIIQRSAFSSIALVFVCAVFSSHALGQNFERYKPQVFAPQPSAELNLEAPGATDEPVSGSDVVLVDRLDAIVLLDAADKVLPMDAMPELDGVHVQFGSASSLAYQSAVQTAARKHLGEAITLRNLNQLSRDIVTAYEKCGQPIVDVRIPEQKVTGGTVQIVVIESRIGKVCVTGGNWTDRQRLANQVESNRSGARILESCLSDDLYWLNQSPFRTVGIDLKPGEADDTTDLFFEIDDVTPIRGYAGYEDTGVEALKLERLYTGFVVGNPLGLDGVLGYQYTADSAFSQLEAHAASYSANLDRYLAVQAFGSWSAAKPTLPPPLNQGGESWQLGTILERYLERDAARELSFSTGFDFKSTNNNVEFGGVSVQASNADLVQLSLGMKKVRRRTNGDFARFVSTLFVGPGDGFSTNNTAADFDSIRLNTDPTFVYSRSTLDLRRTIGCNWEFQGHAVGQWATERLLFSEMLGFGGYDSIRGYDQRTGNGDAGWICNLELGPKTSLRGCGWKERTVRYFAFSDLGQAFTIDTQVGEQADEFYAGAGVGMRMSLSNRLTMRLDYGRSLVDVANAPAGDRIHLGLVSFFGPSPAGR